MESDFRFQNVLSIADWKDLFWWFKGYRELNGYALIYAFIQSCIHSITHSNISLIQYFIESLYQCINTLLTKNTCSIYEQVLYFKWYNFYIITSLHHYIITSLHHYINVSIHHWSLPTSYLAFRHRPLEALVVLQVHLLWYQQEHIQ